MLLHVSAQDRLGAQGARRCPGADEFSRLWRGIENPKDSEDKEHETGCFLVQHLKPSSFFPIRRQMCLPPADGVGHAGVRFWCHLTIQRNSCSAGA